MILPLLASVSSFLHLPLRLLSRMPSTWITSEKAKVFLHERERSVLQEKLKQAEGELRSVSGGKKTDVYWIHVASAGELEQAIPVLRPLHEKHGVFFFLTYFSPSARSFTKGCPGLLAATSLPAEDAHAYKAILDALHIRRLVLVRYDFWPMLMLTMRNNNTPVAVLSATLNKARSPLPLPLQRRLRSFWFEQTDLVFLVSAHDHQALRDVSVPKEKFYVAGDAKWHRAKERAERSKGDAAHSSLKTLSALFVDKSIRSFQHVLVFGSPHEEELQTLERSLSEFLITELVIVAPSEVDKLTINQLQSRLQKTGASVRLLSQETPATLADMAGTPGQRRVLVLDGFGYLAEAYRYADLAIVGGGFDGQLHNVLEPAAYPVLTLYGELFERAPEARLLLDRKAALGFASPNELFQFLLRWSSLKRAGEENLPWAQNLEQTLKNAQDLFGSLPDTSEVVCRALAAQDKLETT